MTTRNVYSNVREFAQGQDVFGNVYDFADTEPTDGWVSPEMSRSVAGSLNRVAVSSQMSRVVVAYPERR